MLLEILIFKMMLCCVDDAAYDDADDDADAGLETSGSCSHKDTHQAAQMRDFCFMGSL